MRAAKENLNFELEFISNFLPSIYGGFIERNVPHKCHLAIQQETILRLICLISKLPFIIRKFIPIFPMQDFLYRVLFPNLSK